MEEHKKQLKDIFSFKGRGLEEVIFLQTTSVTGIAMIVLTINAAIHGLIYPIFVFNLSCSALIFFFFYLARYRGKFKQITVPFLLTILLLINFSWFMSGGYRGSNALFLMVVLVISLAISNKKQRYIYSTIVIINVIFLYAIEYANPHLSTIIPFEIDIVGQGIILEICIITTIIIVVKIKRSYDNDRVKVVGMNKMLSEQKLEIEIKNKELEAYSDRLEEEVKLQTLELESLNSDLQAQKTSLEQFTYILAHNVKSPIKQLQGLFGVLPEKISDDLEIQETFSRMKGSTNKLEDVIIDLSKIVNIRKNTQEIFETVSIKRQLLLAIITLEDQIKDSDTDVDISKVEDVSIKGVRAYVQSIFYNLIHNAIKYSSTGRKTKIKITVHQDADNVLIRVSDNGIGIDMGNAKGKIFQLYQRFNNDRPGKGFGLFLIKTQLKTMGGEIEVESELDKGTTFTIRL